MKKMVTKMKLKSIVKPDGLSMPENYLNARIECALMRGYVIPCAEADINHIVRYVSSAITCDPDRTEEATETIMQKLEAYGLDNVRFFCCATVEGMPMVSFLINVEEDDYSVLPEDACDLCHIREHRCGDSAYWFSYTYNFSMPDYSEYCDLFIEEVGGGFCHRVS